MSAINQKEYLKKYLSSGDERSKKKKRKRKGTAISDRVKIIDDDIDVAIFNKAVEDDLLHGEDAPQIVGVIDERPLELRIDDYRKSDLWTPVGTQNATSSVENAPRDDNSSPPRRRKRDNNKKSRWDSFDERSPPPRNESPPQNRQSDISPPKRNDDNSPPRGRAPRNESDTDFSPPRRQSQGNHSPSRRRDNDSSPPRRRRDHDSSPPRKRRGDNDSSPLRKRRLDNDDSPKHQRSRRYRDFDPSPSRRNRNDSGYEKRSTEVRSHERKRSHDRNSTKPSKDRSPSQRHTSKAPRESTSTSNADDKAVKTLDGKTAGLQNADELVKETEVWKKREDELFQNMSAEVSGKNATAIVRDRRTGKIRDFKKESEEEDKRKERDTENQEKYARWGKGLKQVEEHDEKVSNELYEMSKPLARYADDEDLERYLKEQEREGDPMLAYIRKKKKKKQEIEKKPIKPQYEGEFMPNRYGIRPGYRWDGVDRSNGYEKKWFEVLNSRRAYQEEVYKWSTEDM